MSNTIPQLDVKFIEPKDPSVEYLRKTFKKVERLISKLHKFLTEIKVDYDDIEKIKLDKDEENIIIFTSESVKKKILNNEDSTCLSIKKHDEGIVIKIE